MTFSKTHSTKLVLSHGPKAVTQWDTDTDADTDTEDSAPTNAMKTGALSALWNSPGSLDHFQWLVLSLWADNLTFLYLTPFCLFH